MSREIFVNFGSGNSMVSIRRQPIYLNQGRLIQVDSSTLSEIRINIEIFSWGNFIWKCHLESVGHLFRPLCVSFQIEATSFFHTCKLGDAHFPPPPGAVSGLESLLQHLWQK